MEALKIEIDVPTKIIMDTIITAVEGGINYWCNGFHATTNTPKLDGIPKYANAPLTPDCHVTVVRADDLSKRGERLDLDKIKRGLAVMMAKAPRQFANMMAENGDAITADVFIQCCLFGKLVYG